jgi:methionyl-tRNA formyltransferase
MLSQRAITLDADERAGTLSDKLATLGADLLTETIPKYLSGEIAAQAQDDEFSTYAPMLKKADGELDFNREIAYLSRQVRAYHPWPGSFLREKMGPLKIHKAHSNTDSLAQIGTKTIIEDLPAIAAKDGWLILDQLQPAGKKPMSGSDFLRGARDWNGKLELSKEKEKI